MREKKKSALNDITVAQVSEQKHLGVILYDDMKWSKHINYVCSKAVKKIGLLFRYSMFFTVWCTGAMKRTGIVKVNA